MRCARADVDAAAGDLPCAAEVSDLVFSSNPKCDPSFLTLQLFLSAPRDITDNADGKENTELHESREIGGRREVKESERQRRHKCGRLQVVNWKRERARRRQPKGERPREPELVETTVMTPDWSRTTNRRWRNGDEIDCVQDIVSENCYFRGGLCTVHPSSGASELRNCHEHDAPAHRVEVHLSAAVQNASAGSEWTSPAWRLHGRLSADFPSARI